MSYDTVDLETNYFSIYETADTDKSIKPYAKDGKLHLRAADNWLREIQPKLGFDRTKEIRSLHDGRRTYASIAYLNGVNITIIQKQLGHSSTSMTWEYIKDIITAKQRAEELEKGWQFN